MFGQYPHLQAYRSQLEEKYKNDGRKLEFLAIRALMYEMLKTNGASKGLLSHAGDITHNEAGKPLFRGYHISVSHTKGYAALILSKNQEVAVDIEYFSDRVERIASKLISNRSCSSYITCTIEGVLDRVDVVLIVDE